MKLILALLLIVPISLLSRDRYTELLMLSGSAAIANGSILVVLPKASVTSKSLGYTILLTGVSINIGAILHHKKQYNGSNNKR